MFTKVTQKKMTVSFCLSFFLCPPISQMTDLSHIYWHARHAVLSKASNLTIARGVGFYLKIENPFCDLQTLHSGHLFRKKE